jgi:hypothetical protein
LLQHLSTDKMKAKRIFAADARKVGGRPTRYRIAGVRLAVDSDNVGGAGVSDGTTRLSKA